MYLIVKYNKTLCEKNLKQREITIEVHKTRPHLTLK